MIQYDSDIMPDEIETETKIVKGVYVKDFFIMVGAYVFAYLSMGLVAEPLQAVYQIGTVLIALIVTRKSGINPGKRNYESMRFLIERMLLSPPYEDITIDMPTIEESEDKKR